MIMMCGEYFSTTKVYDDDYEEWWRLFNHQIYDNNYDDEVWWILFIHSCLVMLGDA